MFLMVLLERLPFCTSLFLYIKIKLKLKILIENYSTTGHFSVVFGAENIIKKNVTEHTAQPHLL